ncbi:MAG: AmmeMemoRadiSam system protein A [Verrucomicrobia bacterium]|nr:AmmeMemoRadiSam system protein A [Verrucomicrobiota bacterium]
MRSEARLARRSDPLVVPTAEQGEQLLRLARDSIAHGLESGEPLTVAPEDYPPPLRVPCGAFVTLMDQGDLRGCVGTLEASEPLICNIARYAFAAAFADSRFPTLTRFEFKGIEIHLSLLSGLEPITFGSETELLAQIRPGIDGLVLEQDTLRATLLPSVWNEIPDRTEFLRRLKQKAGLSPDHWSDRLRVRRYRAVVIPPETR